MRLTEVISIVASLVFVFVVHAVLPDYISQILAAIIAFSIIYILIMKRKRAYQPFSGSSAEVVTLITTIVFIVLLTGGMESSLFFFLYFLLFGIAFLCSPASVFVLLVGLIVLFIPFVLEAGDINELMPLGGLVLLSPIAYFFSNEYKHKDKSSAKIEAKAEQILEDADKLVNSPNLTSEDIEEVDEIIQQANDIRKDA